MKCRGLNQVLVGSQQPFIFGMAFLFVCVCVRRELHTRYKSTRSRTIKRHMV